MHSIRLTIMLSCLSMAIILPMHAMLNSAACIKTAKQDIRWQDVPSSSAQNTLSKLNNSLTFKAAHCAAFLTCGRGLQTKKPCALAHGSEGKSIFNV